MADEGEDAARVRDFLSQQNIPADAVLLDSGSSLSNALGSGVYPTTLFVDANGSITASHVGEISRAALLAQRAQLKKEERKSVVTGKSGSVQVDLGGRRTIKKEIITEQKFINTTL